MARRAVNIYINGREIENTMKSVRGEVRKVRRELNELEIGSDAYNQKVKELQKLDKVVQKHRETLKPTRNVINKMSAGLKGYIGVAAAAFTADAVIRYGKELFKLGSEMEVLTKKAQTVFGDSLPSVTAAAEENANAMGLTASQYTDAAAAIGDLLVPMKFTREEAATISTSLVDLSGALSEWTGGQVEATEVTDILGKAILGEREQLKTLGISISEADVQARLAEKGLKGLTGEMLQQAKAAVTLELITEKSTDAQSAFAQNADTLVRKQAELRARFQDIKESLASALIPVFQRLLEVAQPVVENVSDFIIALINGQQATGKYAGLLNFLVTRFQNLGKFVGFVFQLFSKFAGFLFDNFGGAIEFVIVKLAELNNFGARSLNGLAEFLNIDITFNEVDIEGVKKSFDDIRKARLDSEIDEPIEPKIKQGGATANIGVLGDTIETESTSGNTKASVDKSIKALDQLKSKVNDLRTEFQTGLLPEEAQAIAAIEQRYNAEIDKALELSQSNNQNVADAALQQLLELEDLKAQAIQTKREELFEAQLQQDIQHSERLLEEENLRFQEQQAAQAEVDAFLSEQTLSDREMELEELRAHYEALAAVAEEFGINTSEITRRYRDEISRINSEYNKKDKEERIAAIREEAQAISSVFNSLGNIIGGFQTLAEASGRKGAALAKTLALANIAAKTAEAIASGIAASAGIPFPANLGAIATTVTAVLGNIAAAKKILSDAPDVSQRAKGGYFNVMGADDGRNYNAQYLGQPGTGMLPGTPSLVLASEKGPEYFVANEDLKNPVVLNYVRAIENIRRARLGQFQEGGATRDISGSTQSSTGSQYTIELISTLNRLNELLDRGIPALVSDQTAVDIKDRLAELSAISGGVI